MSTNEPNKRSVSTDALETLGTIHTREEKRDAIHLAVEPVRASCELTPGQPITVNAGVAYPASRESALGIVDPFLTESVWTGQRFWFVMMPRAVHSLRHVWTHPSFPDENGSVAQDPSDIERAKKTVHALAADLGCSYDALMDGAAAFLHDGSGMHFGHDLNYGWDMDAFWRAYELLTGTRVQDSPGSFFYCSC